MKYYLFIYEKKDSHIEKKDRKRFFCDALSRYFKAEFKEEIVFVYEELQILKEEGGKPYFKNQDICFSISHSGQYWAVLIGKGRCGLDIQIPVKASYLKIAEKMFSREALDKLILIEEPELLKAEFFKLWVKKEALGKFSGKGLGEKNMKLGNYFNVDMNKKLYVGLCLDGTNPSWEMRELVIGDKDVD